MFTYSELLANFKKSLRNGNWRKLNRVEQAFYRASLWYASAQGKIVNNKIMEKLFYVSDRLLETPGARVLKRGLERATDMLQKYEESGVFNWAPQLRKWLKDSNYIFWLGTFSIKVITL